MSVQKPSPRARHHDRLMSRLIIANRTFCSMCFHLNQFVDACEQSCCERLCRDWLRSDGGLDGSMPARGGWRPRRQKTSCDNHHYYHPCAGAASVVRSVHACECVFRAPSVFCVHINCRLCTQRYILNRIPISRANVLTIVAGERGAISCVHVGALCW